MTNRFMYTDPDIGSPEETVTKIDEALRVAHEHELQIRGDLSMAQLAEEEAETELAEAEAELAEAERLHHQARMDVKSTIPEEDLL